LLLLLLPKPKVTDVVDTALMPTFWDPDPPRVAVQTGVEDHVLPKFITHDVVFVVPVVTTPA